MSYNEQLANRVREALMDLPLVEEKKMFRGICFMVNDKMCVCVNEQELLCRIGRERAEAETEKGSCRPMIHNGKVMKDFVFVEDSTLKTKKQLSYWIDLALAFNKEAKAAKKK